MSKPRGRRKASEIRASDAFHVKTRPSPFSTDAGPQDLRGLYNLAALTLFVMNVRLVVENLLKYGLLLAPPSMDIKTFPRTVPCLSWGVLEWVLLPLVALSIEKAAAAGRVSRATAAIMHGSFIAATLAAAVALVSLTNANVLSGMFLMTATIVLCMKLVSYGHVNNDLRRRLLPADGEADELSPLPRPAVDADRQEGDGGDKWEDAGTPPPPSPRSRGVRRRSVRRRSSGAAAAADAAAAAAADADHPAQPQILRTDSPKVRPAEIPERYEASARSLAYFLAAPTLIYQLEYPRSSKIRWRFAFRRLLECLFCLGLQIFLVKQYVEPTVTNTLHRMESMEGVPLALFLTERTLKLAVPNMAVWLTGFYLVFHSYLNLVAELLRFGDREFYQDWWNASDLSEYWRRWNRPVHHFLLRHVYAPAVRNAPASFSPHNQAMLAQLCVFFVSALLHELLVSVPCHLFASYAFFGMMGQVPLVVFSRFVVKRTRREWVGNLTFWTSFLALGQPLLVLLYAHAYLASIKGAEASA